MLNAPPEMVAKLQNAKRQTQFAKAIGLTKDAIPDRLKIRGQKPLTLLHTALSQGLHAESDETCLDMARAIRVVLVDLADRISQILKDMREINEAVSLLMKVQAERKC